MKGKRIGLIFLGIIVVLAVVYGIVRIWEHKKAGLSGPITKSTYMCEGKKSFVATFMNDNVALALSDGRNFMLDQARSGSGIRYEGDDIIFVGKGVEASIQEGTETTYANCLVNAVNTSSTTPALSNELKQFTDAGKTFSFYYPSPLSVTGSGDGYTTDWMHNATTTGLVLAKIVVPKTIEPNTNFSEAMFTVGTSADADAVASCLTFNPSGGPVETPSSTVIGGTMYMVLKSSDAGAGNLYETTSYRAVKDKQCYAIEYTVHSTNIANYSADQNVTTYNSANVQSIFGSIMQSFTFL